MQRDLINVLIEDLKTGKATPGQQQKASELLASIESVLREVGEDLRNLSSVSWDELEEDKIIKVNMGALAVSIIRLDGFLIGYI